MLRVEDGHVELLHRRILQSGGVGSRHITRSPQRHPRRPRFDGHPTPQFEGGLDGSGSRGPYPVQSSEHGEWHRGQSTEGPVTPLH